MRNPHYHQSDKINQQIQVIQTIYTNILRKLEYTALLHQNFQSK